MRVKILLQKRLPLLDMFIVLVMGILLYYGASWQISRWFTDAGKYQCYSVAFWRGAPALKNLPVPELQCHFITDSQETVFITTSTLVERMSAYHFPHWLISFVASQSPSQPFHALPHEYPLLTIIPFTLGLFFSSASWYQAAFAVWMALVAGAIYFLLKSFKSRRAAIAFALYAVFCGWSTMVARYDIIPAGLTLIALLFAERGRWRWAFAVLALATMFKFYPLILVPAFFIAQQKSRSTFWQRWWSGLDVFVLVCTAITTVSLLLSVEGTLGPLSYFGGRPVQAESSASSILWLASFFGFPLRYAATYGSLNVLSPVSIFVSPAMSLLLFLGLAYTFWLQWRGKITLAASLLLTLLVVLCTGKVFSPQYLIWVLPFVAYIGECDWRWLASWSAIGLLTTWVYPYLYNATQDFLSIPLLPAFHPVVFARNTLMIAFVVALFYHYTRPPQKSTVPTAMSLSPSREAIVSVAQQD